MPVAKINGFDHHWIDEGDGPPIVFLHGATGSHHQFTEEHTPTISKQFRCISPDARGLGRSEHVTDMPATAWVDDLLGLLDHLKIDKAHIMGSSRGSRVALRFAIEYPDRVKSLLLDGAIIAITPEGDANLNRNQGNANAVSPAEEALNLKRHGANWRDVVRNYFNIRNRPGLQEYLNTRDEVHKIEVPVLLMHGDTDDGTHPLASTFELFARLPIARLCIVPNIGYSVNREGGPMFSQVVLDWVERLESGKGVKSAFSNFDSVRSHLSDLVTPAATRAG